MTDALRAFIVFGGVVNVVAMIVTGHPWLAMLTGAGWVVLFISEPRDRRDD